MQRESLDLLAIFVAYAGSLVLWYLITRRYPRLWFPPPDLTFRRPGRELAFAGLAIVGVFLLNVAYNLGYGVPMPAVQPWRSLIFLLNLLLIWSPVAAVLVWRRQRLATALLSYQGGLRRIAWGLGGALAAMLIFDLVRFSEPRTLLVLAQFVTADPIVVVQSLIQFLGFGFILVRLVAFSGRWIGIGVCALLYGLAKYPYYVSHLGMGLDQASLLIGFNVVVAFVVIYMMHDRYDVVVPAIVHVFMDRIQEL